MANFIDKNDLKNKNPWWNELDYKPEESTWVYRDLYFKIEKDFETNLIQDIIGLRRTGKSTLLKQLISKLLSDKIPAERILYYLFDDLHRVNTTENLDNILQYFLTEKVKEKIYSLSKKVYIFLDEIQYINGWQAVLKKYYDLSNKKIKFVLSGSQSILLANKSNESLAGRILDYYLSPLDFLEFLEIKQVFKKEYSSFKKVDLFLLHDNYSLLEKVNFNFGQHLSELAQDYILQGQFPECAIMQSSELVNTYIRESVVGKILEDISLIYDIDKKENFKILTYHIIINSASLLELNNIAREIELSFESVDKYLNFLKSGYLVEILYKQHRSLVKQGRILKKIYTTSTNFICALNDYQKKHFQEVPEVFGKIIETAIYNKLNTKYSKNILINNLSFWREGDKEIDFILTRNKQQLPIEVKFTNQINFKDLNVILNFSKNKKSEYGLVITKNELDKKIIKDQTVYFIPYYLILLF